MYWATIYKAKSCYLAGCVIYRRYHSLESSSRSIRSCLSLKILVFARFGSNHIVYEVLSANSFIETFLQVLFHVYVLLDIDCCLSTAVSTDRTTDVRDVLSTLEYQKIAAIKGVLDRDLSSLFLFNKKAILSWSTRKSKNYILLIST